MPSTDINGEPVLILSLEDAKVMWNYFNHPLSFTGKALPSTYQKLRKFMEECDALD